MTVFRSFSPADATAAAEATLSALAGHPVSIGQVGNLGDDRRRNIVLRGSIVGGDGTAQAIIVKATRAAGYDPSAPDAFEISGLVKEWAATAFLAAQAPGMSHHAELLAADIAQGVLVFRDFGETLPSLVQPLLHGSAIEAETALTAYAVSLGRLHAATLGCRERHADIVRTGFPATTVPPPARNWIDRTARKVATLLDSTLPDAEVALVAERLQSPGPWLALVHNDPCPDNVLLAVDGTAKLIDFEFSTPGHALIDAAYWRMGFPTCWCAGTVPDPVGRRIDTAYRAVLAKALPIAADDEAFRMEGTMIGVAWLLGSLAWLLEEALREDTHWGISSRRSRILHYLDAAIRLMADADCLPGIRHVVSAWHDRLRSRWPSSLPLAPYPAFARP